MDQFLIANEGPVRLAAFAGLLTLFVLAEALWPRRDRVASRLARWTTNGLITLLNTVTLRIAVPVLAVGAATFAQDSSVGLLNMVDIPPWAAVLVALVVLDAAIYAQHVAFSIMSRCCGVFTVSTMWTVTLMRPRRCGSIRWKSC